MVKTAIKRLRPSTFGRIAYAVGFRTKPFAPVIEPVDAGIPVDLTAFLHGRRQFGAGNTASIKKNCSIEWTTSLKFCRLSGLTI